MFVFRYTILLVRRAEWKDWSLRSRAGIQYIHFKDTIVLLYHYKKATLEYEAYCKPPPVRTKGYPVLLLQEFYQPLKICQSSHVFSILIFSSISVPHWFEGNISQNPSFRSFVHGLPLDCTPNSPNHSPNCTNFQSPHAHLYPTWPSRR